MPYAQLCLPVVVNNSCAQLQPHSLGNQTNSLGNQTNSLAPLQFPQLA